MFLGTGRIASVTAEEKETGLLDYQRMTPMSPPAKILGYLFGLPAREYFMFFLTLPFLLHCAVVGEIPLLNLLHLYAVFFSSVILYHLTAHVIGMVVSKPRVASWVARISVLGLYSIVASLNLGHMESKQKAERLKRGWNAKNVKAEQGGYLLSLIHI